MTIHSFLQLVELKTKAASVLPFLIGSTLTFYLFGTFNVTNGLIMFLGTLLFDMTTTAINNYIDYTSAIKKEGYGYEVHNAIAYHQLNIHHVRMLIFAMLTLSSLLGILLVLRTNILVLLMGMGCFAIGILYTFGPLPISRTPFGEIFSGLTMGLVLTFICIYIHVYDQNLLTLSLTSGQLLLSINLWQIIAIGIACIPLIGTIANIMLANNLCDMADDLQNKRYTLPLYLGREKALWLWRLLYGFSFLAVLLAVCLKILPFVSLLTLLAIVPVRRHIKLFTEKQEKKTTFVLSIKNFMLINGLYLISLIIGCFIKYSAI